MAGFRGADVLIKIGNGASEVFTTVAGLRSSSITINDEAVDVTTKDSGGHRALLAGGGVNSVSMSGSGIFTDAASESSRGALTGQFNTTDGSTNQAPSFTNFEFIVQNTSDSTVLKFSGAFMVASLEYAGEYNGESTYSMSFESSGFVTITDNYGLEKNYSRTRRSITVRYDERTYFGSRKLF